MKILLSVFLSLALAQGKEIRVATYNVAFDFARERELAAALRDGTNAHAKKVAEVVQIIQPDVLLLNEFDFDEFGTGATRMNDKFFNVSQGEGRVAQNYPYRYVSISNTGIHSGFDLDNLDGVVSTPGTTQYGGDAYGFGEFPGKYGMAVFSKYPIDLENVKTFEKVLWKDQPNNLLPRTFYSSEEQAVFRLSSKSHWDLPILVDNRVFHFLVSHPTPPVFDGPEDRNGKRNHDEIKLWADYLTQGENDYLGGGLQEGSRFVIAGDQNADPLRGDSVNQAIQQLLKHPKVNASFTPERTGAAALAAKNDTAQFNLRVDYVLPSKTGFEIQGGAVFWPSSGQDGADLVTVSDHRLVYLDLKLLALPHESVELLEIERRDLEVTLRWLAKEGVTYGVQLNSDLAKDQWVELFDPEIQVVDGIASCTFLSSDETGFARVTMQF